MSKPPESLTKKGSSILMIKRLLRRANYRDFLKAKRKAFVREITRREALDDVDDFASRRK